MNEAMSVAGIGNPAAAIPGDLAEIRGAVRLMHAILEAMPTAGAPLLPFGRTGGPAAGVPVLATIYTYALARGWYPAEEIAAHMESDGCLRYLSRGVQPDAGLLRSFRRHHAMVIERALAAVLRPLVSGGAVEEAARRIQEAVNADFYAFDL